MKKKLNTNFSDDSFNFKTTLTQIGRVSAF